MPVWILENAAFGNRAYCTLNEGLGKVLRYGAFSDEVLARLRWIETELAPVMKQALQLHGPIDMRSVIAQALQMGDEGHNRNRAATSLIIRELAPASSARRAGREDRAGPRLPQRQRPFLPQPVDARRASARSTPPRGVKGSSMIVAMARNGTDFGIQISGLGDRWFTGPASMVEGLYLPGFSAADAAPDIGDSVITETAGIGGFCMAAAPAIVKFVGGTPAGRHRLHHRACTRSRWPRTPPTRSRRSISAARRPASTSARSSRPASCRSSTPASPTRSRASGMVGAGLVKPPRNCFRDAVLAFAEAYGASA